MAITRTDTGIQLSDAGLPIDVSNQLQPATTAKPFLFKTFNGLHNILSSNIIDSTCALGWGGKMLTFAITTGAPWYYDGTTWKVGKSLGSPYPWGGNPGLIRSMFVDSNDHTYVTFADVGGIFRNPAGTDPLVETNWSDITLGTSLNPSYTTRFTEDDLGNVYGNEYPTNPPDSKIWKWQNDGVSNGVNLLPGGSVFPGSGQTIYNHVHQVQFDPYRKVLIATHGDNSDSKLQMSGDGGVTWVDMWPLNADGTPNVCTAVGFDNNHIFTSADINGSRGYYRSQVSGTGIAAYQAASPPERVFSPSVLPYVPSVQSTGISFSGTTITSDGSVDFTTLNLGINDAFFIEGSALNNGIHTSNGAATATTITVTQPLVEEAVGADTIISNDNVFGFSWFIDVTPDGIVVVSNGGATLVGGKSPLMASDDDGTTWYQLDASTAASGPTPSAYWSHQNATASFYSTTWDGCYYSSKRVDIDGVNGGGSQLFQWCVKPNGHKIDINPGTGLKPWRSIDVWDEPYDFETLEPLFLDFKADYNLPYAPTATNIIVRKNGFIAGTAENTPLSEVVYDGELSPNDASYGTWSEVNSGMGPVTYGDTVNAFGGVGGSASGVVDSSGNHFFVAQNINIFAGAIDQCAQTAVRFGQTALNGQLSFIRLYVAAFQVQIQTNANDSFMEIRIANPNWLDADGNSIDIILRHYWEVEPVKVKADTWYTLVARVNEHATDGRIRLYIDEGRELTKSGTLIFDIMGIDTLGIGSHCQAGFALAAADGTTVNYTIQYDNCIVSEGDTRQYSATELLGIGQTLLP